MPISCAAGSCHVRRERGVMSLEKLNGGGEGGALLAWPTTAVRPQITVVIHNSNWTHKFQNKTGLDAKANSELYKSNRVNSASSRKYDQGCSSRIPDPDLDFLPIPDPGSRGQKGTGSRWLGREMVAKSGWQVANNERDGG